MDLYTFRCIVGSSPRAWGTPYREGIHASPYRFIPTCMGNSKNHYSCKYLLSVHPHVHGELPGRGLLNLQFGGSSPRAWGTHQFQNNYILNSRFIPTCMGNSPEKTVHPAPDPVHPHVHGELRDLKKVRGFNLGSSPRAWGTLYFCSSL